MGPCGLDGIAKIDTYAHSYIVLTKVYVPSSSVRLPALDLESKLGFHRDLAGLSEQLGVSVRE